MTTPYNQGIFRAGPAGSGVAGGNGGSGVTDPLVPQPLINEIIQELPTQCATLNLARQVPMSTTTQRQPVLQLLPQAYFVNQGIPDQGLKETTQQEWDNVDLVVEEIAAIVPVPDSYIADASIDIWGQLKPRLIEAIGKLIDQACLFGVGRPSTWSPAIVPASIAAGNRIVSGTGSDLPQDMAKLAELLTKEGISNVSGWAVRPGFKWRMIQTRSGGATQIPIYQPDLQDAQGGNVYGMPMREVNNGSWNPTIADLLLGDWSKAICGMRQDITFKMFDQGVLSDTSGKVIWNSMQQDGQAMRVVMRMAFATANPVTTLRPTLTNRYPFGILGAPAGQMS